MKILSSNNCKQLLHYVVTNVSSIHSIVDAMSNLRLRVAGTDDMQLTLIIEKSLKTLLSLCRQREALMELFRDEEQLNAGDDDDDSAMVNNAVRQQINYLERSLEERDQEKIAVEATLKNVREELEDILEDMDRQVLFTDFLQSKIDELAALAEAGGADRAQVAEIKGRSYSSMSS